MTDFQNYKYSSFKAITSESKTMLPRDEIYSWFDGKEEFLKNHFLNEAGLPIHDIHYLEEDGVPLLEIESLKEPNEKFINTPFLISH